MSTALRSLLCSLAMVATAVDAHAASVEGESVSAGQDANPWTGPPRLRLRGTIGIADGGSHGTTAQWPGGTREDTACWMGCYHFPVLDLGVDWSPWRFVGAGLRARWVSKNATNVQGRRWDVLELLLTPRLDLPWPWHSQHHRMRPYFALPIGAAWAFGRHDWSRAVREEWNSRAGLSLGAALGFEFYLRRRFGFVGEIGYQERYMSADVVETPVSEPEARATERVMLRQRFLTVSVGLLLGLDES